MPDAHALPQDETAERGLIGCLCETATVPDWFDPAWIFHDGRRALFCALDMLRHEGELQPLLDPLNIPHLERTRYANGERAAGMVEQAQTWPCADDPRCELVRCLDEVTHYGLIDYYSDRVRQAHKRRLAWEATR
jgi:hypothetical protein